MSSPPSGGSTSLDTPQRRASDSKVDLGNKAGTSGGGKDAAPGDAHPSGEGAGSGDQTKSRLPPPAFELTLASPGLDDGPGGGLGDSHTFSSSYRKPESSSSSSTFTPHHAAPRPNIPSRPPLHTMPAAQMDPHEDISSHHHLPPQQHHLPHHPHHPHHPGHPPPRHALHPQATHATPHPPTHVYSMPSDSAHYLAGHPPPIPAGASIPQPDQQIRYADQAYGTLRHVYAPQMYYDPSIAAAAAAADFAVDPTHAYPGMPSRASPATAYSPQPPVPPQFHPATTTPPVPQGAWTGSPMPPQATFYGSYGGMAPQLGAQHTGPSAMTDELGRSRSLYLSHAAPPPPSAWSASSVMSSHYGFFSPFTTSTERMENMSPVAETWSPQPQTRQLPARPGYVTPQTGAWVAGGPGSATGAAPGGAAAVGPTGAAAGAAGAAAREHRGSWAGPGEDGLKPPRPNPSQHADRDRERKEYHPQPPARRSEWVMWVGNVPSNVSHEELWRFFNTTSPPSAMSNPAEPWRGPSSIFLISRSSCAFVNFSSQADLDRAVPFFHGLSLRPWDPRCPRMVCRIRHKDDDLRAGVGAQRGVGMHRAWVDQHRQSERHSPKAPNLELPDNPNSQSSSSNHRSSASFASTNSSFLTHHFPKRYFILKSLTVSDLEDAVKTGLWKTQRHNQPILDQAFRTSQEVYLIFGANRSGEFFGYAKMIAPSLRVRTPDPRPPRSSYGSISSLAPFSPGHDDMRTRPQLSTPAPIREEGEPEREPAPRSATDPYYRRASTAFLHPGTRAASPGPIDEEDELLSPFANLEVSPKADETGIFRSESPEMFEDALRKASVNTLDPNLLRHRRDSTRYSRLSHLGPSSSLQITVGGMTRKETGPAPPGIRKETMDPAKADEGGADGLAAPFRLQWVKVAPLSFFRTRHLRNPWNGDREVKVSRDGTEVEPNVGAQLIQEWEKLEAAKPEDGKGEGEARQRPREVPHTKQRRAQRRAQWLGEVMAEATAALALVQAEERSQVLAEAAGEDDRLLCSCNQLLSQLSAL